MKNIFPAIVGTIFFIASCDTLERKVDEKLEKVNEQIEKIDSILVDKTTKIDSLASTKIDTVLKKIEKNLK